jgi:phospholipid/cholesterol/gamma-HCH transport system permease protein
VGIQQIIASVGVWAENTVLSMGRSISFFGEFILTLVGGSGQKNRYFLSNFINQIYLAGIRAIPIVMVTNFVVGVVLSYQGIIQLAKFSAESSILTVVSFSVFREAGALMSAIIIAGRSGSAFAAEMGVMNLNEELQALRIMGVKSMSFLILPRVLALLVFMPILTLIANFMGLLGGAVICWVELDMGLYYFFYQVHDITTPFTFWMGFIKTPFFSLIIGLISCFMGLNVKKTPESLGVNTTRAVVLSIFWVIVFNSLFSVIVSALKLG